MKKNTIFFPFFNLNREQIYRNQNLLFWLWFSVLILKTAIVPEEDSSLWTHTRPGPPFFLPQQSPAAFVFKAEQLKTEAPPPQNSHFKKKNKRGRVETAGLQQSKTVKYNQRDAVKNKYSRNSGNGRTEGEETHSEGAGGAQRRLGSERTSESLNGPRRGFGLYKRLTSAPGGEERNQQQNSQINKGTQLRTRRRQKEKKNKIRHGFSSFMRDCFPVSNTSVAWLGLT